MIACKDADIEYLVNSSPNRYYVTPDNLVYYGCAHWVIKHLLEQNEFKQLSWTVFCANFLPTNNLLPSIRCLQKNEANGPVPLLVDEAASNAIIDPQDIGEAAARVLFLDDSSPRFRK